MTQFLPTSLIEQLQFSRVEEEGGTRLLSESDLDPQLHPEVTWFDQNWMFIGPPALGLMLVGVVVAKRPTSGVRFLAWALPFIYTIHQFEEHGWDILGKRYSFIDFFNGRMEALNLPIHMTVRLITIINVLAVWVMMPSAALYLEITNNAIPALFNWGLAFFNGLAAHVLLAIFTFSYNPGFAQSLCIMLPAGAFFFKEIKEKYGVKFVVAAMVFGGPICHGVFLVIPLYLVSGGALGDVGFGVWMFVGMSVPFLMAQCVDLNINGGYAKEDELSDEENGNSDEPEE